MSIEGFEPSPFNRIAPEATALDRSAKLTNLKFSDINKLYMPSIYITIKKLIQIIVKLYLYIC